MKQKMLVAVCAVFLGFVGAGLVQAEGDNQGAQPETVVANPAETSTSGDAGQGKEEDGGEHDGDETGGK